ncbi:helix-turn-helix domain-containing protein [Chromatocurvus halotolerans]
MPALCERLEDVPQLIRHFQSQLAEPAEFTPAALAALQTYDWPGNVRELGNLVERMGIMQPGHQVQLRDLPERYLQGQPPAHLVSAQGPAPEPCDDATLAGSGVPMLPAEGANLKDYLASIEIALVQQALQRTNGIVAHSAELLGLRRTTLVEKIKKYGIDLDTIG